MIGFVVIDSRGVVFSLIAIHWLLVPNIRHCACRIDKTAASQGGAAEFATCRKTDKYSKRLASVIFQPIAVECPGAFNQSAVDFLSILGSRLVVPVVNSDQINSCFSASPSQFRGAVAFRGSFGDFVADADCSRFYLLVF